MILREKMSSNKCTATISNFVERYFKKPEFNKTSKFLENCQKFREKMSKLPLKKLNNLAHTFSPVRCMKEKGR